MENNKTLDIMKSICSHDNTEGKIEYNNETNTMLFNIEQNLFNPDVTLTFILHPQESSTPSDIITQFESNVNKKSDYRLRIHYDINEMHDNVEKSLALIDDLSNCLANPDSVMDLDISNFDRYIEFLHSPEFNKKDFHREVIQAIINLDKNRDEYVNYLKTNGVDLNKLINGNCSVKEQKHNVNVTKRYKKDLFSNVDDVLPKTKIIRDNVLSYLALSQNSQTKKIIDKLPIQHIKEIKHYINHNPEILKSVRDGIKNRNNTKSITSQSIK